MSASDDFVFAEEERDDSESAKAVLNDAESLRQGVVQTTKGQSEYTLLLVGETGTGKTSFLSLLYNVLAGHPLKEYVERHDKTNESGVSQAESQTQTALIYEFVSKNGVRLRILDTPGLADTRGLAQDELHKQSIAETIQDNIAMVNGVLILANGTVPRLGAATDYALTTLMSIFPLNLADNITILFTNVTDVMNVNFDYSSLPEVLSRDHLLYINNPLAMRNNLEKTRKLKRLTAQQLQRSLRSVQEAEGATLDTLVELFDWMDGRTPQPTLDFISLYERTQSIDRQIANALARMKAAEVKQHDLRELEADIDQAQETMRLYEDFHTVVTRKTFHLQVARSYNEICSDCHNNCKIGRELQTSMFVFDTQFLEVIARLWFFTGSRDTTEVSAKCNVCNHLHKNHRFVKALWEEKEETVDGVDEDARKRFTSASTEKERKESMRELVKRTLDALQEQVEDDTKQLGHIAEEYAGLSLSGSFASQVHKSVRLLETKVESMRNDGTGSQVIASMEHSLERLKDRLRVLEEAQRKTRGGAR